MLSDLCRELHNYFEKSYDIGKQRIVNGNIVSSTLREGQYFRIIGSVFNDGVYKYPETSLTDEEFDGAVWELAIPKDVVQLSDDIDVYNAKYGDQIKSPYTSESFGGYSYSKASGAGASSGNGTWKTAFADRLARWRKLP